MKAYIRGIGNISPQKTYIGNRFPDELAESHNNLMRCIEPSYLDFLNPVMARRMGRVIKMGIAAAMICLKDSKVEMPDAIITGTALGCLGDTEKFLKAIIADDEQYLTPTSFIQSIQNSVSAQIALQLNCTSHNFTFVHKGFSFESALLDALLLIQEEEAENVLVGGIDEMTDHNFFFYKKLGLWKQEITGSANLLNSKTDGTIGGEGAAFFILSKEQSAGDYARLQAIKTIYNPGGVKDIEEKISEMLNENQLSKNEIDLVIYGFNGDTKSDQRYSQIMNSYFKDADAACFKHLCGEYQTSGAFAMWLASVILKSGNLPSAILLGKQKSKQLSNIVIYNSYDNNHVLYLLSRI